MPGQNTCFFVTLELVAYLLAGLSQCDMLEMKGPVFTNEPPDIIDFSNVTGAKLECSARGIPMPSIQWIRLDGSLVTSVPRLLTVMPNGSLIFMPFRAETYRQDIHASVYKCVASNSLGTIISRNVKVRGVVKQFYEVQVYDEFVILGNTAVLRCHVPSFVRDHVSVAAWIRDDASEYTRSLTGNGRNMVSTTGELNIRGITKKDGSKRYRCKTEHRLTGETRLSLLGTIVVTDPQSSVPPRITNTAPSVKAKEGGTVELSCTAQAFPIPTYRWMKLSDKEPLSFPNGGRIRQQNNFLIIQDATIEDSGLYTCLVNNSVGEEHVETTLTITADLKVRVQPQHQLANVGGTSMLNCDISGHPVHSVSWIKDGQPIQINRRIQLLSKQILSINDVTREDRGMYQCFVANDEQTAQGSAEITLGDAVPEFRSRFGEMKIKQGSDLYLQCVVSSNPPVQMSWQLDDVDISAQKRFDINTYTNSGGDTISNLNVTETRVEDGGIYTCIASNRMGNATSSARINIWGPPYIRPIANATVIAGARIVLKCPVTGYPIQTISWERESRSLPINLRQTILQNGTFILDNAEKSDAGSYTCIAINQHGQRDKKSMWLSVVVPPRIDPFSFPRETREGLRARLLCSVIDGDSPMKITWLKDDQTISPTLEIVIQKTEEFSSLMIFKAVTKKHNGNYSCVASNSAGQNAHTAELQVQVPPYWITEPRDSEVLLGKGISLDCRAGGFPLPNISWMKSQGKTPGSYVELHGYGVHHQVFLNGSLTVNNVQKSDEGYYLCQAINGIGSGQSKVVFLRVNVPAHFRKKEINATVQFAQDANLTCEAIGDKPMEVQWSRNGRRIDHDRDQRFSMKNHEKEDGLLSELSLHQTARGDGAIFQCYATNAHGHDEAVVHLTVQEQPGQPSNLILIKASGRNVTLSWKSAYNGNDPIRAYVLQCKKITESWETNSVNYTIHGSETSGTIGRLSPGTPYHVRAIAINSIGSSEPSNHIDVTTLEEEPGDPPLAVEAKAAGSEAVKITWKPPKRDAWNGLILGYYIGYKIYDSSDVYKYKTVEVNPTSDIMEYHLSHLKKYTKYSIVVNAFNRMGRGPSSDEVIAITDEDAPDEPPQEVACIPLSSQSAQATWMPPPTASQNGKILGYKIFYRLLSEWEDEDELHVTVPSALKVNLHALHKYSNYSVQALAYTRTGAGVRSEPTFCRTQEDVPGPPVSIKALVMTSDCILVTWLPPKHQNGNLIKYTIYIRSVDNHQPSQHAVKHISSTSYDMSFEARGLKENQMYEFWITASTVIGEGESTKVIKQIPQSKVIAQIASFSSIVISKWKGAELMPCRAVGLPTPTRQWKFRNLPLAENNRIKVHPDGTLELRDLLHSDTGNYTCEVQNIYGKDSIMYSLIVQAPPSSPTLIVVGTATTSLQLKIQPSTETKGGIKGYTLTYKRDFSEWEEIEIDKDDEIITLENLRCGTLYHLYMTAFNKVGAGEPSETVQVVTKGAAPKVRKIEDVLTSNVTALTVHLRDWPDGGCLITYFVLKYKRIEEKEWRLISNKIQPQQGDFVVLDLDPSTWYSIEVTAHNAAGFIEAQYTIATLTQDGVTISPNTAPNIDGSGAMPFVLGWNVFALIAAAIAIVLIVMFFGVCLLLRRRKYRGYHNSYSASDMNNTKMPLNSQLKLSTGAQNSIELSLTPTPGRKHRDSSTLMSRGQEDSTSPYTHFRHPNKRKETMISSPPLEPCNMQLEGNNQDFIQHSALLADHIAADGRGRRRITHLTSLNKESHESKALNEGVGRQSPNLSKSITFEDMNDCQQHIQGGHLLIYPEYDSAATDSEHGDIDADYYTESAAQLHDRCPGNLPDLLYHGTDSSTSNDTSPDNDRRLSRISRGSLHNEQLINRYPTSQGKQELALYLQESHQSRLEYADSNEMLDAECDRDMNWRARHEQQLALFNCNHNRLSSSSRPVSSTLIKTYDMKAHQHTMDGECCNGSIIRV